jgi:(S)-2-hydroxyglutarate dehydrogenase
MPNTADFIIIGAGIIGVNLALELRRRNPGKSVLVLEKERRLGLHGSGRNSGVLHAGFYYTADSLKARFTRDGNRQMKAYIKEKGLPINECGKLVVTKNEGELGQLDELFRRAERNGVEVEELTEAQAKGIDPRAKTCQRALYSPHTATAEPLAVLEAMKEDAELAGVGFALHERVLDYDGECLKTDRGAYSGGYIVNAAGLYADQIAHRFGFGERYRILPFKGLYLYSSEAPGSFQTNIYPVPDLRNPFLGVHVTLTTDGHAKIGPTAIPAFWREQYGGMGGFSLREFAEIALLDARLWFGANFAFRSLARQELAKYNRRHLVKLSESLARGMRQADYVKWGKPGIRAQLLDVEKRALVMDFLYEGDERSFHVLNTVSPGWTCSIPFSKYLADAIEERMGVT